MRVPVRLSGELAQKAGVSRTTIQLPDDSTVTDLLSALSARYPELAGRLERAMPVMDGRHLSATDLLQDGREIALILPIGGGQRR